MDESLSGKLSILNYINKFRSELLNSEIPPGDEEFHQDRIAAVELTQTCVLEERWDKDLTKFAKKYRERMPDFSDIGPELSKLLDMMDEDDDET